MDSNEYTGPERRIRNEHEIEVDKRLSDFDERMKRVEQVLVNEEDPDAGMVAAVHKIKHDLANNTQITIGNRKMFKDMNDSIENLLAMMGTFTALNQFAHGLQILLKRILPVVGLVSSVWGAVKIWGPK